MSTDNPGGGTSDDDSDRPRTEDYSAILNFGSGEGGGTQPGPQDDHSGDSSKKEDEELEKKRRENNEQLERELRTMLRRRIG
ncbi:MULTISPECIES: hypothetical protein [Pseudofrankia]|uniref:hypothetical protein n=1 Tax=Pseudofrankia TaxID=2994363 RepID=UPI000234B7B7|nr:MULTISPECIES: hypothetical protein [Pseudofrankia]